MAAGFEARRSVGILEWHVKRRLKGVRDYRVAPRIFHPDAHADRCEKASRSSALTLRLRNRTKK